MICICSTTLRNPTFHGSGAASGAGAGADSGAEAENGAAGDENGADEAAHAVASAAAFAVTSAAAADAAVIASAAAAQEVASTSATLLAAVAAAAPVAAAGRADAAAAAAVVTSLAAIATARAAHAAAVLNASAVYTAASAAIAAASDAAVASFASHNVEAADSDAEVEEIDIVSIMRYVPFGHHHSKAGGKHTQKLLDSAQRQSDFVTWLGNWSDSLSADVESCTREEYVLRFCVQRLEIGVRIADAADLDALQQALKSCIEPLFDKVLGQPLDVVCSNAALQFSLFQCKYGFWTETLGHIQKASEVKAIVKKEKQTAMKYVCAQMQVLLTGTSRLITEAKIKEAAEINRVCCYIGPNALPDPLLTYLRARI